MNAERVNWARGSAGLKLPLVDYLTADDSANDFDILDFVDRKRVQVFRQNDIVRQLARGNRAFDVFLMGVIGAVKGIDPDGFVERDPLIRAPGLTVPTGACNHALKCHTWIERSGAEIGTRGSVDTRIEKSPESHRAFHQVFPIETEFV